LFIATSHTTMHGSLNIKIIRDIVEYIDVEGLHAPVLGGLKILLQIL